VRGTKANPLATAIHELVDPHPTLPRCAGEENPYGNASVNCPLVKFALSMPPAAWEKAI
jgi:hypothetical protein